ncbi:hypothetical protein BDZ91DRAFT_740824, partial [Kalaharituber pfeilii]
MDESVSLPNLSYLTILLGLFLARLGCMVLYGWGGAVRRTKNPRGAYGDFRSGLMFFNLRAWVL